MYICKRGKKMYKKIAIVGAPGTGKTTLANNLSEIYKIPATHIDGIHHLENWEIRDKEERDKIILEIIFSIYLSTIGFKYFIKGTVNIPQQIA